MNIYERAYAQKIASLEIHKPQYNLCKVRMYSPWISQATQQNKRLPVSTHNHQPDNYVSNRSSSKQPVKYLVCIQITRKQGQNLMISHRGC